MKVHYVEIVRAEGGVVVRRIEAGGERSAERVERGANINLNHDLYYTRIVEDDKPDATDAR